MNEKEEWKPVVGYEGYYEVSNTGRVRSVDRCVMKGTAKKQLRGKEIVIHLSNHGYCYVDLYQNATRKRMTVHRLVAEAFIPRVAGMDIVNHKDEDPTNNNSSNLEWCTFSYNNTYGKMKYLRRNKKPVAQLLNGTTIATFISQVEAANALGKQSSSQISHACRTGRTAYGYNWRFV